MSSFWKMGMPSQDERDAELRARVATTAINAQKIVDEFAMPEMIMRRTRGPARINDKPMYGVAHSDVQNSDAGPRSTMLAAKHYAREAQKRRDELLAQYEKESQA